VSAALPARIERRSGPAYGWHADGKSAAEISSDIRQTRYRLESDVRALREALEPRRLLPAVAVSAGLAVLSLLIRRILRKKR
jgi:uncharacterized protein DUF3618